MDVETSTSMDAGTPSSVFETLNALAWSRSAEIHALAQQLPNTSAKRELVAIGLPAFPVLMKLETECQDFPKRLSITDVLLSIIEAEQTENMALKAIEEAEDAVARLPSPEAINRLTELGMFALPMLAEAMKEGAKRPAASVLLYNLVGRHGKLIRAFQSGSIDISAITQEAENLKPAEVLFLAMTRKVTLAHARMYYEQEMEKLGMVKKANRPFVKKRKGSFGGKRSNSPLFWPPRRLS